MSRVLTGTLALLAAMAWTTPASAVPILSIDADPTVAGIQSARTVDVGASFTIDIVVSGVEASAPVNGYDVILGYGAGLAATSAVNGTFLLPPSFNFGTFITAPRAQIVQATLLPAGAVGAGVLASVTFDALVAGPADLDLIRFDLTAPFGAPIASGLDPAALSTIINVVSSSNVPEPPVFALLIAGIVLLARRARCR